MKFSYDQYNHLVRLQKGELLVESLIQLVKSKNTSKEIKGSWLMGLGAARWAEIGTYNLETKDYKWQKLDGPLEIISLQGNVAWEGDEPVLHIHGTFSDDKLQTYGGHIKELEISATCEIFMHHWWGEDRLTRLPDDETGLKLLDL